MDVGRPGDWINYGGSSFVLLLYIMVTIFLTWR